MNDKSNPKDGPEHSYKQINELTLADLDKYPVWEFLSEDDIQAKDECTVKGYKKESSNFNSNIIVKAKFKLNDGTVHYGFVKPEKEFATNQPVIIFENNHIHFWHGVMKPSKKIIVGLYQYLAREPEDIFPIKWTCEVEFGNLRSGIIKGFGYYDSVEDSFNDIEQLIT